MVKLMLYVGGFAMIFSVVWLMAMVNGFDFLQGNSEAFRSFSNGLYCGGDSLSITYGSYIPNSRPSTGGGRTFKAVCKAPNGTQTADVTYIKTNIDMAGFFLLLFGGMGLIAAAIKLWIKQTPVLSVPQSQDT